MYKELLGAAAVVLTFAMFVPYIRSIRDGRTKPHVFSWIIWALGTFIVFLAQLADRGGFGAWPIGVSGVITGYIAVLAYGRRSDTSITRTDWAFLAIALAAVPSWLLTSNPLLAVVLLTGMDLAGFAPTFRHAFSQPHEEFNPSAAAAPIELVAEVVNTCRSRSHAGALELERNAA